MNFSSKNESGEVAWKQVLDGRKTVTRRLKPMVVGTEFAVCPRGKKAVCRAKVISCVTHHSWAKNNWNKIVAHWKRNYRQEALDEGFISWGGMITWFNYHKVDINETYRIQFKVIK